MSGTRHIHCHRKPASTHLFFLHANAAYLPSLFMILSQVKLLGFSKQREANLTLVLIGWERFLRDLFSISHGELYI